MSKPTSTTPSSTCRATSYPASAKTASILRFCGQHLGGEAADAEVAGDRREVLEEDRADALALVLVADVEGDLGAARVDPVVAADADDLVAQRHDEGDPVDVVDVGEAVDVGVAEPAQRGEEPQVDRLVGLRGVEAVDPRDVGGPDRPHARDGAVPEDDVGLPVGAVARGELLVAHGPIVPPAPAAPSDRQTGAVELRDAVRRRRMVRRFDPDRPVAEAVVRDLVGLAVRAPSAGFSQGWDFLVLLDAADRAAFWGATDDGRPSDSWRRGVTPAPALVLCLSHPDAYLDRYALPDKGWTDRSPDRWPVPYWDTDTAMAAMVLLLGGRGRRPRGAVLRRAGRAPRRRARGPRRPGRPARSSGSSPSATRPSGSAGPRGPGRGARSTTSSTSAASAASAGRPDRPAGAGVSAPPPDRGL